MIDRLRLHTKVALGGFVLAFAWTLLHHDGWVSSTTLPRFTYMAVATVALFVIASLLLLNDIGAG